MKKRFKYLLIVIFSLFLIFGAYEYLRRNIGGFGGPYPFAKTYEFGIPEKELLDVIAYVKANNAEIRPFRNSPNSKHRYWTNVTFYYSDTEEFVNTWTRSSKDEKSTTFALVSLVPRSDIRKGRKINADYDFFENRKEIKKFEEKIIEPIKAKIKMDIVGEE